MKRFLNLITAGVLSSVVATASFAAPGQHGERDADRQHPQQTQQQHKKSDGKAPNHASQQRAPEKANRNSSKRKIAPSRDWKVGGKVPSSYHSNNYKVGHSEHKLPRPGKNQRWIKVNGDYVLGNVISHAIIRIISI